MGDKGTYNSLISELETCAKITDINSKQKFQQNKKKKKKLTDNARWKIVDLRCKK